MRGILGTLSWAPKREDSSERKSFGIVLSECWEDFQYFIHWMWGKSKVFCVLVSAILFVSWVFIAMIFILIFKMFFVFPHP